MGKSTATFFVVLALALAACSPSPQVQPTLPPPTKAATPTASVPTAGQLAEAGKTLYGAQCARCHGENGEGVTAPANLGPKANLEKFATAQTLLAYITASMPQDSPGTLSPQEYMQVFSFLLVQNKFVQPDRVIDVNKLNSILLQK